MLLGVNELWKHLSTRVYVSDLVVIYWVVAGLAGALVASKLWAQGVRPVVVWAHEWGHVVATLLYGGRVTGIRLYHETSGDTESMLPTGFGKRLRFAGVAFWGMPAPVCLGLGLTAAVGSGYGYAGLVGLCLLVAMTVLLIRNWWGLLLVGVGGAVLALCVWLVPPSEVAWPVLLVATTLMWGGLRDIFVAMGNQRVDGGDEEVSDARAVAKYLWISPWIVLVLWMVIWLGVAGVTCLLPELGRH